MDTRFDPQLLDMELGDLQGQPGGECRQRALIFGGLDGSGNHTTGQWDEEHQFGRAATHYDRASGDGTGVVKPAALGPCHTGSKR